VTVDKEPFDYHDYHRTIVAFHGTTEAVADRLVAGGPFTPSGNKDDWLGSGVYFWEYAPKQAWWWARRFKKNSQPAVVGAMIRLGNCFDLLDPENVQLLKKLYNGMLNKWKTEGTGGPSNFRHRRNIECAVFNYLYDDTASEGKPIDSARAVYVPTDRNKRIWRGSWIYEEAHIQVCVRNQKNILAVWHVGPDGRYGRGGARGPHD
jgi:hypothetical protein